MPQKIFELKADVTLQISQTHRELPPEARTELETRPGTRRLPQGVRLISPAFYTFLYVLSKTSTAVALIILKQ